MLTVGGAGWAEAAAEREAQLTAADEEAAEIARQPQVEHAEVVAYYEAKGLTPQLAREVADQLMAHDAVDAQLESEHGILEIMSRGETVRAGIGSAIAYLLGAAIPLIVTVVVPATVESSLILAAVFVSLIVTSAIGARTGHMKPVAHPRPRAHRRPRDDGRQLPRRDLDLLTDSGNKPHNRPASARVMPGLEPGSIS